MAENLKPCPIEDALKRQIIELNQRIDNAIGLISRFIHNQPIEYIGGNNPISLCIKAISTLKKENKNDAF